MANGLRTLRETSQRKFSVESDDPRYWQRVYATAVVIAQILQENAVDPQECVDFNHSHIHQIFMSQRIFTFDENLIFSISVKLLQERHDYTYKSN